MADKFKFTPGPWVASKFGFQVLTGDSWSTVCTLKDGARWEDGRPNYEPEYEWQLQEVNAHLIAAAPDHHANAVEFDRLCLVIESAVRNADPSNIEAVVALIKANRAALSKAEGREGES